jgi:hypothetical protein
MSDRTTVNKYMQKLLADQESAAKYEHPERLLRITLECAHMRLMKFIDSLGGIGWSTHCNICDTTRKIVNVEETGVL